MEVPFPESLDPLDRREVEEDHCGTEAETVPHPRRPAQVHEAAAAVKREQLRDAIARGYEDAAAGRVIELASEGEIDALFHSLAGHR
jgi:hypothetical protein